MALSCSCFTIAAGWLIFLKAPCIIVCDRIKFNAARVRTMTAETADYDAIMGYLQEARELTLRLAVALVPPLVGNALVWSLIAVQWIMAASIVTFAVRLSCSLSLCRRFIPNLEYQTSSSVHWFIHSQPAPCNLSCTGVSRFGRLG